MTTEEYISSGILELYISGILSNEEAVEVEQMAAKHPEIKAELDSIESTMLKLSELNTEKPGDRLFDGILSRINEGEDLSIGAELPLSDYDEDNIIPLHPFHDKQRRKYISLMVASVALFMISSLLNVYFFSKWKGTEKEYTAFLQKNESTAEQLKTTSNKLAEASKELESYHGPMMKVIMLESVEHGKDYKAIALWNKEMKSVNLKVMNLPAAPSGKQYQLWALADGKPVDAGMISDMGKMESMKSIPEAQAFAITLEKAGGSPTPTLTAMVVMGKVEI